MAQAQEGAILPSLDEFLFEQIDSETIVREFLDDLITNCAQILHSNYLTTQIKPYAARTIAHELILNASWAKLSVSPQIHGIKPDDDLQLPRIDQWSNGALRVELPSEVTLRSSVCQERPEQQEKVFQSPKKSKSVNEKVRKAKTEMKEKIPVGNPADLQSSRFLANKSARTSNCNNTDAFLLTKLFEDTRRQAVSGLKNVTLDTDMNVIAIQEPKISLGASLIVPRVTTKRVVKSELAPTAPRIKAKVAVKEKPNARRSKALPSLVEAESPKFDEDAVEVNMTDKFVCMPGVTFRDGSSVKSKPMPVREGAITRIQYEQYRRDLERRANGE